MELKDQIKEIIAEIEKGGDVKAVFGEPVREGGITLIPVASMMVTGGGGGGVQEIPEAEGGQDVGTDMKKWSKGKGFGMGFAKKARPVGFIKIKEGEAKFEPIIDKMRLAMIAIPVAGILGALCMKLMMKKKYMKRTE